MTIRSHPYSTQNNNSMRLSSVIWNITNKCNFDCSFCYTNSSPMKPYGLDTNSMMKIARMINDSKISVASLIGGEPLIRADINKIIDEISSDTFIKLDTNGSLIRKKWNSSLDRIGSFSIGIDGPIYTNEIYRKNTSEVVRAIDFLIDHDKTVNTPMVITAANYSEIKSSLRFIFSLGVSRIQINNYIRPVNQSTPHYSLKPSEQEFALRSAVEFLSENPHLSGRVDFNGWKTPFFFEKIKSPSQVLPQCKCGELTASISFNGLFLPCNVLTTEWAIPTISTIYEIPSLLEKNITEAYNSLIFSDFRNSTGFLSQKCSECSYKFSCNHGCRGYALAASRDIYSHIPTCNI